jgi:hypothetical protein
MRRIIFTYEPDNSKKIGHQRELYQFKLDGCDTPFYCAEERAEVHKLRNQILDVVEALPITQVLRDAITKLIEDYGDARVDDAREDWWENEGDNFG